MGKCYVGIRSSGRQPKWALAPVSEAYSVWLFPPGLSYPRISVIVCSYNGQRPLYGCLAGLLQLDYPNFEVIVVDDASTDQTATTASEYGFNVIQTGNRGLRQARTTRLPAASAH